MVLLLASTLHEPSLQHLHYFLFLDLIFSCILLTHSFTHLLLHLQLPFQHNSPPLFLSRCFSPLFSTVPSVPSALSLSFLSLYFLSASGPQSPSLLLVPGPSWHCNQTPGISSRPTLAGRNDTNKTPWLLLRLLECYSVGRNLLLPLERWILMGFAREKQ